MELVLLNPRLDARRAMELGLVTAVYPTDAFDDEVRRVAVTIAAGPVRAFAAAKGLLNQASGMDRLDVHLDREIDALARSADGAEFAEGLDSFFGKRPARFPRG
jgi:enoyl-CoA hydratase/carnithine racemase